MDGNSEYGDDSLPPKMSLTYEIFGHDHNFGQKNLDYASQAPLHPGYACYGPNDDHGPF